MMDISSRGTCCNGPCSGPITSAKRSGGDCRCARARSVRGRRISREYNGNTELLAAASAGHRRLGTAPGSVRRAGADAGSLLRRFQLRRLRAHQRIGALVDPQLSWPVSSARLTEAAMRKQMGRRAQIRKSRKWRAGVLACWRAAGCVKNALV